MRAAQYLECLVKSEPRTDIAFVRLTMSLEFPKGKFEDVYFGGLGAPHIKKEKNLSNSHFFHSTYAQVKSVELNTIYQTQVMLKKSYVVLQ